MVAGEPRVPGAAVEKAAGDQRRVITRGWQHGRRHLKTVPSVGLWPGRESVRRVYGACLLGSVES